MTDLGRGDADAEPAVLSPDVQLWGRPSQLRTRVRDGNMSILTSCRLPRVLGPRWPLVFRNEAAGCGARVGSISWVVSHEAGRGRAL